MRSVAALGALSVLLCGVAACGGRSAEHGAQGADASELVTDGSYGEIVESAVEEVVPTATEGYGSV